jgi:deoxyhypusine synthase
MTGGEPKCKNDKVPDQAKDAVFLSSEPVPEGVLPVRGIDFNLYKDRDISIVDLVEGMSYMGFQASAIGDAVRIINEMVRRHLCHPANTLEGGL